MVVAASSTPHSLSQWFSFNPCQHIAAEAEFTPFQLSPERLGRSDWAAVGSSRLWVVVVEVECTPFLRGEEQSTITWTQLHMSSLVIAIGSSLKLLFNPANRDSL